MNLHHTLKTILENETNIQDIVLKGINVQRTTNTQEHINELSVYVPPLIRYALEDWYDEYQRHLEHHPNKRFGVYLKEQEGNLIFHFKWSLTHKAETIYRHAHAVLWNGLNDQEQNDLLYGLRYLINEAQ